MKKFDLIDIGIKIFGLYFLATALITLKSLVVMWVSEMGLSDFGGSPIPFGFIYPVILYIGFDLLLASFLIFKSKILARSILKGEREIEGNFHIDKKSVIQISIIILGGLVVTRAIEAIGVQLIAVYQTAQTNTLLRPNAVPELIWECIYGIIGYALILSSGAIANKTTRNKSIIRPKADDGLEISEPFRKIVRTSKVLHKKRRPVIPKPKGQSHNS